jgi:hypothetical protein
MSSETPRINPFNVSSMMDKTITWTWIDGWFIDGMFEKDLQEDSSLSYFAAFTHDDVRSGFHKDINEGIEALVYMSILGIFNCYSVERWERADPKISWERTWARTTWKKISRARTTTSWKRHYHSIRHDIPPDAQAMVKRVYIAWYGKSWALKFRESIFLSLIHTIIGCIVTYTINMVACFANLLSNANTGDSDFAISLMYLIVGVPIAFVFWYRPLYNAVK